MALYAHLEQFAGMPVEDWDPAAGDLSPLTCYRVALDYDAAEGGQQWTDRFATLLDHPDSSQLAGIVVGAWGEMFDNNGEAADVVEALVSARDRLTNLRAIFFGDIISEECEISWIQNTDVSLLLDAYPELEHFGVRGANGLTLGPLRHGSLRTLVVESGGLDVRVVREVAGAELPALEHLDLWLGAENYGANATVADLAPILDGSRFPRLSYLGLRDSEIADEIAQAAAAAPILERIQVLDLSLGTLSDAGAEALLASPAVARLKKLDIHHHYCTPAVVARLEALGVELNTEDAQQADEDDGEVWRYVAVSE